MKKAHQPKKENRTFTGNAFFLGSREFDGRSLMPPPLQLTVGASQKKDKETSKETDEPKDVRQILSDNFKSLEKKGVLSDLPKEVGKERKGDAVFEEKVRSQKSWDDRKKAERKSRQEWAQYKKDLKQYELDMDDYKRKVWEQEQSQSTPLHPPVKPKHPKKPQKDKLAVETTCIDVALNLLKLTFKELQIPYKRPEFMNAKKVRANEAWVEAGPSMSQRPKRGDLYITAKFDQNVKQAERGVHISELELENIMKLHKLDDRLPDAKEKLEEAKKELDTATEELAKYEELHQGKKDKEYLELKRKKARLREKEKKSKTFIQHTQKAFRKA